MKLSVKIILFLIALFFFSVRGAYADGIQLSSTVVGTTATFTSQIPADPCGSHKLGETKTRTVVGFTIATTPFNMEGDVMKIVNEKRADLTDAIVSNFTISGRTITDFKANTDNYASLNWQDFIHYKRDFKLDTSVEFTPQDTASIVVTNVKILNKGTINPEFALLEPNGQFCLGSKYTIITIGTSTQPLPTSSPTMAPTKPVGKINHSQKIETTPTIAITKNMSLSKTKQTQKTYKSFIDVIRDFFKKFFG